MKRITLNDIPHIDEELNKGDWEALCKAKGLKVKALNSVAHIGFLSSNIEGRMVANRLVMAWEVPWPDTLISKYYSIDNPGIVSIGSGIEFSVEII
ncbi:MAG: hypothetical protein CMC45_00740 [Flavobacteriaceae bacterium]|nr:hypothetical protein [Flavobacteriaceae bacterium]|tara:strand:+ start:4321 stop:4608 length:288 start_codon:yes stop_codon:yes gene_type:complete